MMNRFFVFFFFCVLLLLNACSPENSSTVSGPFASVSISAMSPDAPKYNLFLNGNNIAASLPFGSTTVYNQVSPGTTTFKAQSTTNIVKADTSFTTVAANYYSIFITDTFANTKFRYVTDNLSTGTDTTAQLRFFNFSPTSPAVDIFSISSDSTFQKTIWKNRSIGDDITRDSFNTFTRITPGTYTLVVIRTNSKDTLAKFPGEYFTAAANYTVTLQGMFRASNGDTTLQLGIRKH